MKKEQLARLTKELTEGMERVRRVAVAYYVNGPLRKPEVTSEQAPPAESGTKPRSQ